MQSVHVLKILFYNPKAQSGTVHLTGSFGLLLFYQRKKLRAYIFKLAVVQIGVEPASGQQVVVGALLHNVTIPHD